MFQQEPSALSFHLSFITKQGGKSQVEGRDNDPRPRLFASAGQFVEKKRRAASCLFRTVFTCFYQLLQRGVLNSIISNRGVCCHQARKAQAMHAPESKSWPLNFTHRPSDH